jgi:polysaccharide export outer membrane protein
MIFCKKMLSFYLLLGLLSILSYTYAGAINPIDRDLLLTPALSDNASSLKLGREISQFDTDKGNTIESRRLLKELEQRQQAKSDLVKEEKVASRDPSKLKSEFQAFVAKSTGVTLPLYGFDLFSKEASTYAPVDNIPVTPDYTIGPGDELLLHIWGQIESIQSVVVDRNGMISIPKVGQVSVVGVRYQNLQAHIKAAISKIFRNFEVDVSLGKLRSIQVFVVGQALLPGNYTVSSLSTLVNALFASGGPSAKGSMRHIQLKRSGKVVTEFDMYDLLLKGDKSKDVQLLSGDVIYIPGVGPTVAVSGSVNTPAIYELKGNESLSDLLILSGGLTNVAAGQKVTVERIRDRGLRLVKEFQLDALGLAQSISDGDLVVVRPISPEFENAVTLRGNVAGLHAGRHPWREGLRITDLIPNKAALLTDNYWALQNQSVGPIKSQNDTQIKSQNDTQNDTQKMQTGDVQSNVLRENLRNKVAEINWDYASIERLDRNDLTTKIIPFNLAKAMLQDDEQNIELQAGDVITLFSKQDIQSPIAKRSLFVILEGEFKTPGMYQVRPGETLRQLVLRHGGITSQASLSAAEFTRESARLAQQKRLDDMTERMESEIVRTASRRSSSAIAPADAQRAIQEAKQQESLVEKMRAVKALGRIVLEMPSQAATLDDLPDIALEDGDRLYIPSLSSTVTVMGTVYNHNTFIYKQGLTVNDYLEKAGGPTRDGDADEVYLVRANGLVFSKRQTSMLGISSFGGRKTMPGDTIIVPEKLERYNLTKDLISWSQVFYQFMVGVSALKNVGAF